MKQLLFFGREGITERPHRSFPAERKPFLPGQENTVDGMERTGVLGMHRGPRIWERVFSGDSRAAVASVPARPSELRLAHTNLGNVRFRSWGDYSRSRRGLYSTKSRIAVLIANVVRRRHWSRGWTCELAGVQPLHAVCNFCKDGRGKSYTTTIVSSFLCVWETSDHNFI